MGNNEDEVSVPIETARIDGWESQGGSTFRYFESTARGGTGQVRVVGFQRADGSLYDLAVAVNAPDSLPSQEAQRLIEDLTWALAELHRLGYS